MVSVRSIWGLYVVDMWLFCDCHVFMFSVYVVDILFALLLLCGCYEVNMWFLFPCNVVNLCLICGCFANDILFLCG